MLLNQKLDNQIYFKLLYLISFCAVLKLLNVIAHRTVCSENLFLYLEIAKKSGKVVDLYYSRDVVNLMWTT